jgi:hypothetical protein
MSAPAPRRTTAWRLERAAWPLTVVSLLALPLSVHLYSEVRRADDLFTSSTAYVPDLAVLALLLIGGPLLWQRRRSGPPLPRATLALGGLAVALVPSLLFHPGTRGVMLVAHWAGAAVLAGLIAHTDWRHRRWLGAVLAMVVAVEAVLAWAQQHLGPAKGRVLPWYLGEVRSPVVRIGTSWASAGTTLHPYVLAALVCTVFGVCVGGALRRWGEGRYLMAGGGAAGAALALTASRSGVLAAALVVVAGGVGAAWQPPARRLVAKVIGAFALGALVFLLTAPTPWRARYDGLQQKDADQLSGRGELIHEAAQLIADHPLLGVGPGRYTEALRDDPTLAHYGTVEPVPVHLLPLLAVAEAGIPAAVALVAAAVLLGSLARRAGAAGAAVVAGLAPFLLLDHLGYTHGQGVLLTGVCVGFYELAAQPRDSASRARPVVPRVGAQAI